MAAAGNVLTGGTPGMAGQEGSGKLRAVEVNSYLRSLCRVKEPSVDRFIIGDPETEVTRIGTCWMPYLKTLRKAVEHGVNIMVVHEPTFYSHWDLDAAEAEYTKGVKAGEEAYRKAIEAKRKWIDENRLVVIRCHDVLDIVPEFGVPFAFGEFLGFSRADLLASRQYYNVYRLEQAAPAHEVARRIAGRLRQAGQPGVAFYGDPDHPVKSIGLGTGCACDPLAYMDLAADLYIGIDDTIRTWTQTTFAEDSGLPLIVINHGTSEEFGMRALNRKLREAFPRYEVEHFNQGCGYAWVTA